MDYFSTPKENQVWRFDQMAATINKQAQVNPQGFCAGMVITWILLRSKGKDFKVKVDKQSAEPVIDIKSEQYKSIKNFQNIVVDQPGRTGYAAAFAPSYFDVEKAFRIESDNGKYENLSLQEIDQTVAMASARACTWFLLRLRNSKNAPGHVVAIEVRGAWPYEQTFRLMDLSNGCVEFVGVNSFGRWMLTNLFRAYRQLYTGYLRLHKVWPQPTAENALGLQGQSKLNAGWW
jgi:hypothetical protein